MTQQCRVLLGNKQNPVDGIKNVIYNAVIKWCFKRDAIISLCYRHVALLLNRAIINMIK